MSVATTVTTSSIVSIVAILTIAAVIPTVVVGTALCVVVGYDSDALTTKFFTIKLLDSAIRVFASQILQDAITDIVTVNVSK